MGYRLYLAFAPAVSFLLLIELFLLFRFRKEPAGRALSRYTALCLWLLVTNSAEQVAMTPEGTLLFARLSYLGILLLPLAFGGFALRYTGHDRYIPYGLRIMLIFLGFVLYGFILTSNHHLLFWRDIRFEIIEDLLVMQPHYGPIFWFAAFYCWIIIVMCMVFILRAYGLRMGRHRARSLSILIGALLPGLFNMVYVLKLVPSFRKDFTPIGFGLSAVAFFIGGFMIRAVQLVPMARGVVLEELSDGYLVLDAYSRLSDFNLYAGKFFHLENRSIGRFFKDIPTLKALADCYEECSRLMEETAQPQPISVVCNLRMDEKYMLVKVRAVFGSSGLRGVVFTISDISQQLEMQRQLDIIRSDLLKRERFAVIGRLSADLAHEINNPLGYVWSEFRTLKAMMAQCPKSEAQAETVSEMVGSIEEGLSRIEKVVGSLLEYSRRGGRQQGTKTAYDLIKAIHTALELAHGDYDRIAGIHLDLEPVPELMVYGNEIDQVLLNLLRNAVDAIKERVEASPTSGDGFRSLPELPGFRGPSKLPGQIRICCRVEDQRVVCTIGNNGSPLDYRQAETIFEPFYSTKPGNKGTGLGLSISREIIEKHHGGSLVLSSIDPVEFRFELPITQEGHPWPQPDATPTAPTTHDGSTGSYALPLVSTSANDSGYTV